MFHPNEDLSDRWKKLHQELMSPQPGEDAADHFIRIFKDFLRPDLVQGIPDDFFQPGREMELGRQVEAILDARLIKDKVPIGRQLRKRLLESQMADIRKAQGERLGF